jgi:hypothetical protein
MRSAIILEQDCNWKAILVSESGKLKLLGPFRLRGLVPDMHPTYESGLQKWQQAGSALLSRI